jgi:MFS family permease
MNLLNLFSNYLILLWMPAILHTSGVSPSWAIFSTTMYGLGLILGGLLTAPVVDHMGVERILTCVLTLAALCVLSIGYSICRFGCSQLSFAAPGSALEAARRGSTHYPGGFIRERSARPGQVGRWARDV